MKIVKTNVSCQLMASPRHFWELFYLAKQQHLLTQQTPSATSSTMRVCVELRKKNDRKIKKQNDFFFAVLRHAPRAADPESEMNFYFIWGRSVNERAAL